jgi:hypothetical protein
MMVSQRTLSCRQFAIPVLILIIALAAPYSQSADPSSTSARPPQTLQTIMRLQIDRSADFVWDSVETVVTRQGEQVRQPRTAGQWAAVRRHAQSLVEGGEQLETPHRRVSEKPFVAEAQGALDSTQIQQRIDANWPTFLAFAQALERTAREQVQAVDAHDVTALVSIGGQLDAVCEGCHLSFWYPNQLIPPLPTQISAR